MPVSRLHGSGTINRQGTFLAMRGLILSCTGFVAIISLARLSAQTVLIDKEVPLVVDRAVIIKPEEFTPERVQRICHEFLNAFGQDRGMRRLIIGTNEDTVRSALFHGSPLGDPGKVKTRAFDDRQSAFDSTVEAIRNLNLPKRPVARVLAVGDAAILTVLDIHGYTEKLLVGTSDPTLVQDGRISYRLLHFVLTPPGPALRPDDHATSIYFEATDLSVASVVRLTRRFKRIVRGGQLSVAIRPDTFFPETWEYPAMLPFVRNATIPSDFQYLVRGNLTCAAVGNRRIGCSGINFRP
jgi:hypothetical protein